ncbi:hypothetical protein GCM10022221_45400 [Actinocorallia aurea]
MTGSADVLRRFRAAVHEAHPRLTELDRLAGDGDFGDNLRTGLDLTVARLDDAPDDGRDAFTVAAEVFLDEVGGTSGPLFGLLFQELGRAGWAEGSAEGLAAIQRVGEARVGDRTMIDALAPAAESLRDGGSPVDAALAAVAGAHATAALRARMGRASYVGDRAQGSPDPGAVGVALLFWARAAADAPSPALPDLRRVLSADAPTVRESPMSATEAAVSTASVRTDRPGRYGKQLVSHLTRRATGEWSEEAGTGWLDFGGAGRAELTSGDGALELRITAAPDDLDRYEDVVGRHLVRFGARSELVVAWVRADGTPGTVQRNDAPDEPPRTG